jgi:ribosomal subunit interface protein
VEIVVSARHADVRDGFRRHLEDKLAKVEQLAPRAHRLDVEITHEANKRQSSTCERVELTVLDRGPVIRAEACADDVYAALDLAYTRLLERLRRARDRRKVHHGRHKPTSVHDATRGLTAVDLNGNAAAADLAGEPGAEPAAAEPSAVDADTVDADTVDAGTVGADTVEAIGDSPVVIRRKVHDARPMSLDDALYEMELVGHDFFLFIDSADDCPSVVYRRRGWSYGVIRLRHPEEQATEAVAAATGTGG